VDAAEDHLGIKLPTSLRAIILRHNGASVECESGRMSALISFSDNDTGNVYDRYELPSGYLPFGDDGSEGCYAIAADSNEGIVLWEKGSEKKNIAKDFDSFLHWLDEEE
jgi:hypothetical protein